jgi:hypothetical protein
MHTASEEYTRRTMQLGHYDTLGTVDDESAIVGHIGNGAQEYVLNYSVEVLMVGVGAIEFEFRFQGHTICQTALQTLLDGITWAVDVIVKKFKNKVVTSILDREVLGEHFVESFLTSLFGRGVHLEEVVETLQLDFQEVRKRHLLLDGSKVDSLVGCIVCHC